MHLVRLIYSSEVSSAFSESQINGLLESAKRNNKRNSVTGLLCFNHKYFLQCLEGSREHVNKTYHKILNDDRHDNAHLLSYEEISHREFSQWSMGYMPHTHKTAPLNLKYSGSPDFQPYAMSGSSCNKLLMELKEMLPTV